MNIKISLSHFKELIEEGYGLDVIFYLRLIDEGADVEQLQTTSKLKILYQTVRRKGLITEENKITVLGRLVMKLESDEEVAEKIVKTKPDDSDFEKWWKLYPGTDTFTYKGQSFTGSRAMRAKKEDCKTKFNNIIAEGEYTAQEMIDALQYDVMQKKENSIKTKVNRLTYMQNSLTYLNQRSFEPFIELIREGKKIVESPEPIKGTDI